MEVSLPTGRCFHRVFLDSRSPFFVLFPSFSPQYLSLSCVPDLVFVPSATQLGLHLPSFFFKNDFKPCILLSSWFNCFFMITCFALKLSILVLSISDPSLLRSDIKMLVDFDIASLFILNSSGFLACRLRDHTLFSF